MTTETAKKYRPSNGTEGEAFMQRHCARCARDGGGASCDLIGAAMAFGVEESGYPAEWTYTPGGRPTCTAFEVRTAEPPPKDEAAGRLFDALHPIFRDCVDPDAIRYDLALPFFVGGFVYATDGKIAVRQPATPEAPAAEVPPREGRKRLEKVGAVFHDPGLYDPTPIPAPDTSGLTVCPSCRGVDRLPQTYEDWERFDEDGLCLDCGGAHVEDAPLHPFEVGRRVWIGAVYARLLDRRGATLYLARDLASVPQIRFTVGPVEGVLMPVRREGSVYPPE